jgi:hypothetical protein
MRKAGFTLFLFCSLFLLSSCEFRCSVGDTGSRDEKSTAVVKDGARIYNNIQLNTHKIKINKAYLVFADGKRVPDDNFTDFSQPVKLQLFIDSGWTEKEGRVLLGAAEKITAEDGTVVLEDPDLFAKYADGVTASDAKMLYLSATLRLKENSPPASFTVSFRIWDKNADGYIEGNYKLYSK